MIVVVVKLLVAPVDNCDLAGPDYNLTENCCAGRRWQVFPVSAPGNAEQLAGQV